MVTLQHSLNYVYYSHGFQSPQELERAKKDEWR